jgi:hypothetical protein
MFCFDALGLNWVYPVGAKIGVLVVVLGAKGLGAD